MPTPRVLVVESDPSSLGMLTHGMNRLGLAAEGATDADAALSLLSNARPDVVVSDVDAGAGIRLLEELRQNPDTRDVPMLFLTKGPWARRRAQVRELGAQELVSKPAFVQDIAVLTWLYAGHSAKEEWFEGTFGEPSCAALLRGLLASGRSGTLRLEPSDAIIRFRDGAVIDASLPPLTGERALFRVLTLETGNYELTFIRPPSQATMQFELADLQTRGLAHVRLWEKLKTEIEPLDQVLTVDFENLASRVASLPRGLFSILRLFDGKRTIADVIAASPLDDVTAGQAIAKLRSMNLFEQGRRNKWEANTPVLGRPTPLDELNQDEPTQSLDLPPLADETTSPTPLRLTAEMAMASAQAADANIEHAFFSTSAAEESTHVRAGDSFAQFDPARANPIRGALWALAGLSLIAAIVLLWRSVPSGPRETTPESPVAATAVQPEAAPAAAPSPAPVAAQPAGLSETSKRFDKLMSTGALAYDKEDFSAALEAFQAAQTLEPDEPSSSLAVGSTLYNMGKLEAANTALAHTVELDPANGRAEILLGAIAQERGQKALARDHYENYLSIDPEGEHADEVKALLRSLK